MKVISRLKALIGIGQSPSDQEEEKVPDPEAEVPFVPIEESKKDAMYRALMRAVREQNQINQRMGIPDDRMCPRCHGGAYPIKDCAVCGGVGVVPDTRKYREREVEYTKRLIEEQEMARARRGSGAGEPGPTPDGHYRFRLGPISVVLHRDQLRALLDGMTKGAILWGVTRCDSCPRLAAGEVCSRCQGMRTIPIIASHEAIAEHDRLLNSHSMGMPSQPFVTFPIVITYDSEYNTMYTEEMSMMMYEDDALATLRRTIPPTWPQLWIACDWMMETADDKTIGDRSIARTAQQIIRETLVGAWVGYVPGLFGNVPHHMFGKPDPHLVSLYRKCRARTASSGDLSELRLLLWRYVAPTGRLEGYLHSVTQSQREISLADIPDPNKTQGRPQVWVAGADGTMTRVGQGEMHPEDTVTGLAATMAGVETGMGVLNDLIEKEQVAMARAEPGESLRSAMGEFEIGDDVVVRQKTWDKLDELSYARLLKSSRNRMGKILARGGRNGMWEVEHPNGDSRTWSGKNLKLLQDTPFTEIPDPQAVDFGMSDDDYVRRLKRRKRIEANRGD